MVCVWRDFAFLFGVCIDVVTRAGDERRGKIQEGCPGTRSQDENVAKDYVE